MEHLTTTPPLLLLIVILLPLLLILLLQRLRSLPPGPWGFCSLPFAGPNLHRHLKDLAKTYGPIFSIRFGTRLQVVISSASLADDLFKTQDTVFANHASPSPTPRIPRAPSSICATEWRILLNPTVIESSRPLRQQVVERALGSLRSDVGTTVDLRETSFSILLNMLLGLIWGEEGDGISTVSRKEVLDILAGIRETARYLSIAEYVPALPPFDVRSLCRRMSVLSRQLDDLLSSIIMRRLSSRTTGRTSTEGSPRDFLQLLLELVEKRDHRFPAEITQVKTMMMEALFAGLDASATAVEWAMTELVRHPRVMAKLREELDTVVGIRGCVMEESHIPSLSYLSAVMKESMRLHPALPFVCRNPGVTCRIGGYSIPKGTDVFLNIWAMHRDPSIWKEPLEFRPERFLEQEERWEFEGKSLEFMPFGTGMCPGVNLAEKMMTYIVGSLVHTFRWELPDKNSILEVDDNFEQVLKKRVPLVLVPFTL